MDDAARALPEHGCPGSENQKIGKKKMEAVKNRKQLGIKKLFRGIILAPSNAGKTLQLYERQVKRLYHDP
jgi:hypothetical protein